MVERNLHSFGGRALVLLRKRFSVFPIASLFNKFVSKNSEMGGCAAADNLTAVLYAKGDLRLVSFF